MVCFIPTWIEHSREGVAGGTGIDLFCLGYFQLPLSRSPAECPSASFGKNLPVLTHLGMERAELATDACCTSKALPAPCSNASTNLLGLWHQ